MAVAHDAGGSGSGIPVQVSSSVQASSEASNLQKQFIAVLNNSSEDTWRGLLQYLSTLSSYQLSYYASLPETEHYLQRLLLLSECGRVNELNIRQQLHNMFPKIVELSRPAVTDKMPLSTTIPAAVTVKKKQQRARHHKKAVTFSGTDVRTLYTYQTRELPVTFQANLLHVDDLVLATERVASESLAMERWTRHPAGLKLLPQRPHSSLGFHRFHNRPTLYPLLMSDIATSPPSQNFSSGSHIRTLKTGGKVDRMLQLKGSTRTGATTIDEVLRAFAIGQLTSKDEVYLNYADSIPWNSYKLVVVSKRQANPEHFVATGFGIFHVYPDGEIESHSLAEWSRDTSVHHIIKEVPVFRDYLVSKMIRNWKQNVRRIKFNRNLAALTKTGIRFHSPYQLAIRKVKSLCEDLLSIDTSTVTPAGDYKGSMFWRHVESDQIRLQRCLNRYFRYCQRVINECATTQKNTVLELENHRKHQPFVSDLPISIQKEQHNKLECDLEEGKRRVSQINALVMLARMMMVSNLREFMNQASSRWMEILLQEECDEDDETEEEKNASALLNAELQFSSNGDLILSLNMTLLRKWLSSPVHILGQLMRNSIDLLAKDCPNPATSDPTAKPSPSPTTMKDEEEEEEARLESARAREKLDVVSFKKSPNARSEDNSIIELVTRSTISDLENCEHQLRAKSRLHTAVELICSEVTDFCSQHDWLCEVNHTVQHWKKNGRERLSKMSAEEVETTVMSSFVQLDKLSRVPSHFFSTHRILFISNEQMISSLRPQVHTILSQLMKECLNTVTNGSNRLIELTRQHIEMLSCKRYDLEGFAEFAQTLHRIHQYREVEQPKLSHVTKTLQALISSGTGVSDGVKELVEEGVRLWEECGDKLREAEEFVASQTPMKSQGLHKNITGCEEEMSHLVSQVNEPPFTNPNELCSTMLSKLEQINLKVQIVRSRLADLGKWNKAITEESYDQAVVSQCLSCLYARQEIWRYKQTFEIAEREWLDTQFRKLDVEALGIRIAGWLESADKLAETLPDGDPVLYSWQTQLAEYHNYHPLLMRLSSKSLKVSHWHTIFAGAEEVYHPGHHYTLRDLIIHHVLDYPDTLTEICHKAEKEAQLRHSVTRLQEGWETRQVSVLQSPLEWYQFAFPNTQDVSEGKSGEKITFVTSAGTLPCLPSTHLLTVINTNELCESAEEDLVQLQILLGSPYLGQLKGRADHWQSILRQLLEVLSLISTCQQKWMNLLEVFATLSSDVMVSCGLTQLQEATASYQEVVDGINGDPRPLSLLQKRRGEKGSRELQGELLRQVLNDTIDILDTISQQMECITEDAYSVYPRLRILTNTELLQIMSSSCPTSMQSIVHKLFPAISNLVTVEVNRMSEVSIVRTREKGVQIVAVEDYSGEQLTLATPLHTQCKSSVEWLKALDKAMRYSLACQLSYSRATIPLVLQGDSEEDDIGVVHWFTESLCQAALLALELHWSSVIHAACDDHDESTPHHSIDSIKESLENVIHHCAEILRCSQPQQHHISSSLSVSILSLKHKVDILGSMDSTSLSLHPFYHTTTPLLSHQPSFSSLHSGRSSPLLAKPLVGSTKSLLSSRHDLSAKSSLLSFPTSCVLTCGSHTFSYGYEYRGGVRAGIVLTPPAEKCLVSLLLASGEGRGGTIMEQSSGVMGQQTALDLAKLLGRAYHHVSCSADTREITVTNALFTSLQCGSVLIIDHIANLPAYLLIKLQQWMTTISTALSHTPQIQYPMSRASSSRLSTSSSSTSRVDWYSGIGSQLLGPTRELEIMGRTVIVRDQFTCVAVLEGEDLPHAVRRAFRGTDLLVPDTSLLAEALLLSHGFRDTQVMSKKLSSVLDRLTEMAGNHHLVLPTACVQVRRVVEQASIYRHSTSECASIVASIVELWAGVCGMDTVLEKLLSMLIGYFGADHVEEGKAAMLLREESWLTRGLESELEDRGLIQSPALIDKALQLHRALGNHSCVVLAGVSGVGKTSCYRTLAAAYNSAQHRQWCVNVSIVMPAAYSTEELFGEVMTSANGMQWSPGILTRLLQNLSCEAQHSAAVRHWVVLEGPMSSSVMNNLNKLLSTTGLHLPSGEILHLPSTCKLIIETDELSFLSPSCLTHCVVVHCPALLSHNDILEAWLQRAPTKHNMSTTGLGVLAEIIKQVLPKLLDYTATYGNSLIESLQCEAVCSLVLTEGFLTLLSALLERNAPKQESSVVATSFSAGSSRLDSRLSNVSGRTSSYSLAPTEAEDITPLYSVREREKESIVMWSESRDEDGEAISDDDLSESSDLHAHLKTALQRQMGSTCFFALVWSFGAYLPSYQMIEHFSGFIRELISQHAVGVSIPLEGTVFDYWLDMQTYNFKPWQERRGRKNPITVKGSYVVLPELERYSYIVDLYMSCGKNVLLVGDEGIGKTSFVQHCIKPRMPLTRVSLGLDLPPNVLQSNILGKQFQLNKKQTTFKVAAPQRLTFFLDDLHLASSDQSSSVIELILQLSKHHSLTDYHRCFTHELPNVQILSTCCPTRGRLITARVLRTLIPVPFFAMSDEILCQILYHRFLPWLQHFPLSLILEDTSKALAVACVTVFRSVTAKFHPLPSSPQLLFTLHDLTRVYQGLLLISSKSSDAKGLPATLSQRRRGMRGKDTLSFVKKPRGTAKSRGGKSAALIPRRSSVPLTLPSYLSDAARKQQRLLKSHKWTTEGGLQVDNIEVDPTEIYKSSLRSIARLWCHENTRVFADRLTETRDQVWFVKLLETCLKYCFCGASFDAMAGKGGGRTGTSGGESGTGPGRRARLRRQLKMPATQTTSNDDGGGEALIAELTDSGIQVDVLRRLLAESKKLMEYGEIAVKGEDVSGLLFVQLPKQPTTGDLLSEESDEVAKDKMQKRKMYKEMGDGQVKEALVSLLKTEDGMLSELIIDRQALEHTIRLCRVMTISGGHGLLLGPARVGRKTLAQLAAVIAGATVFTMDKNVIMKGKEFCHVLRDACCSAGVEQKQTVLIVDSTCVDSMRDWRDLIEVMSEGLSPNLFTASELIALSGKLQAGRIRKTAEGTQQAFASQVLIRLHVIVTWNMSCPASGQVFNITSTSNNTYAMQCLKKELFRRMVFNALLAVTSHVDVYQPWTKTICSEVAFIYWQQHKDEVELSQSYSQLEALSMLAAHVHLTTAETITNNHHHNLELVSPRSFLYCLRMTLAMVQYLTKKKTGQAEQLHAVLGRLSELERAKSKLEYELEEELRPFLRRAEQEASHHMEQINAAKRKYMAASQRCKDAEEVIKAETATVQELKKLVNAKLDEVSPQYMSALQALSSVRRGDILEVVSYRIPPGPLQPIFNALCLLFDRPQTWEDCQQLMLSQNFFESLRFFDKDHVSQSKLKWLCKKLEGKRNMSPSQVGQASRAVVPLLKWLIALLDYHKLKHEMAPDQQKLDVAEKTLAQANEEYVDMRKEMLATKRALEETVKDHKEELKNVRSAEGKVKSTENQLQMHKMLTSQLAPQKMKWEGLLEESQQMLECVPVHALLTAAAATYLSPLPILTHHQLWKNWLDYCNGAVPVGSLVATHEHNQRQGTSLVIKKGFSIHQVLAEERELCLWEQNNVFPHDTLREKAVLWRANQMFGGLQFCFILDPHNQFKQILEAFQETYALPHKTEEVKPHWSNVEYLHASELTTRSSAQQTGRLTVLTTNKGDEISSFLHQAIVSIPLYKKHDMSQCEYYAFVYHQGISSASDSPVFCTLSSMSVLNLKVEEEGMVTLLKHHILQQARYQLWVHQKALLADLAYHKLKLNQCEDAILNKVLNAEMLDKQHHLASVMKELNENEMSTLDQVKDTQSALDKIREDSKPYTPLAKHASLLLRVGGGFHPAFTLDVMKSHLGERLRELKELRYHDSKSCLAAHLLRIKQQLTLCVVDTISHSLPADRKLMMLLAIGVAGEVERGRLNREEERMLIEDASCSTVRLLELMDTQEYPTWTSEQSFSCAHELQRFSCFRQLTQSLQTRSESWQEYFFNPVLSLVHNTPLSVRLSLSHKLLLWKILRPDKFQDAVLDFVSLILGSEVLAAPSSINLLSVSSSSLTTLCLYCGKEQSLCDMLKPATSEVGVDLVQLSLVCDGEDKVKEVLMAGCWVVLEHVECSGSDWQRSLKQIMEDCNRPAQSHLWIPLPLETTIGPWLMRYSHNIVCLSSSTTTSSIVHHVRPQCGGAREIEEVMRHLLALLSPTQLQEAMYSAENMNTTNWLHCVLIDELNMIHYALQSTTSSLTHLMSYLRGEEEYTIDKGDLLQQVVSNTLPTKWATFLGLPTTKQRPSLSVALRLVQSRVQFLTQALSSVDGALYPPLNVAWFSHPSSLLRALVDSYSHHNHLTTDQVTIATTITDEKYFSGQEFSIIFTNLHTNTEDSPRVALQLTACTRKEKGEQETVLFPVLLRGEEGRTINTGLMVELPTTNSVHLVQHW